VQSADKLNGDELPQAWSAGVHPGSSMPAGGLLPATFDAGICAEPDLNDCRIRAISCLSEKTLRERLAPVLTNASADGATAPETLRHKDRGVGRSGERRLTAPTEGDIRTARAG